MRNKVADYIPPLEEITVVCPLCGQSDTGFFDVGVYECPNCGALIPEYRIEFYKRQIKRIAGMGLDWFADGFGY